MSKIFTSTFYSLLSPLEPISTMTLLIEKSSGCYELMVSCFVSAKINANFSQCGCPIACEAEVFNVKLSYVNFPNDQYGRDLGEKLNITLPDPIPGLPTYTSKLSYIRYL